MSLQRRLMPDFFQHARLPTLHHLAEPDLAVREAELAEQAEARPVVVLVPALGAEFHGEALPRMLEQAARAPFVSEVMLSVNGLAADAAGKARELAKRHLADKPLAFLWNDSPRLQPALAAAAARFPSLAAAGKGANVWLGAASLLARGHRGIIIGHDADILSYEREILSRLAAPLLHPRMGYRFAKGYYTRASGRLHGRVTRLLVFPLIQSFIEVLGAKPLLAHLDSFRYPLAGEFAAEAGLLASMRLPSGWGLEIAMLCESHRLLPHREMCQVDLGINFMHRHRSLDTDEENSGRDSGLAESAAEVAACLFSHVLRDADERAAEPLLRQVCERYRGRAEEWIARYEHVALINGLESSREDDAQAAAVFAEALPRAIHAAVQPGGRRHELRPPVGALLEDQPQLGALLAEMAGDPRI